MTGKARRVAEPRSSHGKRPQSAGDALQRSNADFPSAVQRSATGDARRPAADAYPRQCDAAKRVAAYRLTTRWLALDGAHLTSQTPSPPGTHTKSDHQLPPLRSPV